jgi:hypothetical protein
LEFESATLWSKSGILKDQRINCGESAAQRICCRNLKKETTAQTKAENVGLENQNPFQNPEPLLTTLARLFALEGLAAAVAVLSNSAPSIEQVDYDNWNGGTDFYTLVLYVSASLYAQLGEQRDRLEQMILDKAKPLLQHYRRDVLTAVSILPELTTDPKWREKAQAWLAGKGVTNQGRVRTDNIAPRSCDGLLFRSQPEIHLYQALKGLGVSFAPLPVFIRGGDT